MDEEYWYEELGLDTEPFNGRQRLVGHDEALNNLVYTVFSGNMAVVEGGNGLGKTRLLMEMAKKFGGRRKVIYINSNKVNGLNIEQVIKKSNGFFGRLLKLKPNNMILLLDDIEQLSERNCERIKYYYDMNFLRSVVFSCHDWHQVNVNDSIKHRVHSVIRLNTLSDYEAVKVVRQSVNETLLPDRAVKLLYKRADRNVGKLVEYCKRVLKEMAKQKVTEFDDAKFKEMLERL